MQKERVLVSRRNVLAAGAAGVGMALLNPRFAIATTQGRFELFRNVDMANPAEWSMYNGYRADDQGPRWLGNNIFRRTQSGTPYIRQRVRRAHEEIAVYGGVIQPGQWMSAGMSMKATETWGDQFGQNNADIKFGAVEIEARALVNEDGTTQFTRFADLLWPQAGQGEWPAAGEIDFFEAGAWQAERQGYRISNHYADAYGKDKHHGLDIVLDTTQWHTYRTERYSDKIIFYVDGSEVWRCTENVPQTWMRLGLQTAQEYATDPDKTELRTRGGQDIRAVRLYRYIP